MARVLYHTSKRQCDRCSNGDEIAWITRNFICHWCTSAQNNPSTNEHGVMRALRHAVVVIMTTSSRLSDCVCLSLFEWCYRTAIGDGNAKHKVGALRKIFTYLGRAHIILMMMMISIIHRVTTWQLVTLTPIQTCFLTQACTDCTCLRHIA